MPSCYLSKLDNIFDATIFKSSDLKDFGNDSALHLIIKALNILEKEGITVTYKGETKIVYFTLGLILGDNLGLNSILGFTKSFSSNFLLQSLQTKSDVIEYSDYLRTKSNYLIDLEIPEKERVKLTGINEQPIFTHCRLFI